LNTKQPLWLTFAPVIFLTLWSSGYVAAKSGLGYTEPMTFLALRFACVIAIMIPLFVILRPPLPARAMDWAHLAIVGFLLQSVYFGMCYMAFSSGLAVGTLALILSMQPILVGLIAPRWAGQEIGWKAWLGLLLGLLGAGLVIVARSAITAPTAISFLYGLLALAGITGSSLWEKRFGVAQHPVTSNLIGFTVGLIGILPFMFVHESMHIEWSVAFSATLAYLVVGNSLIATGLLLAMIRAGDVTRVSALFFLVPPLAALCAWIVLNESMPPLAWVGMVLAGSGVFIATRSPRKTA